MVSCFVSTGHNLLLFLAGIEARKLRNTMTLLCVCVCGGGGGGVESLCVLACMCTCVHTCVGVCERVCPWSM